MLTYTSYWNSYKVNPFITQLHKHLSLLVRQNLISLTLDLNSAELILVVFTQSYVDGCEPILSKIMQIHASKPGTIVVPVILEDCNWSNTSTGIEKLQSLPSKPILHFDNLDEAFLEVSVAIRAIVTP